MRGMGWWKGLPRWRKWRNTSTPNTVSLVKWRWCKYWHLWILMIFSMWTDHFLFILPLYCITQIQFYIYIIDIFHIYTFNISYRVITNIRAFICLCVKFSVFQFFHSKCQVFHLCVDHPCRQRVHPGYIKTEHDVDMQKLCDSCVPTKATVTLMWLPCTP